MSERIEPSFADFALPAAETEAEKKQKPVFWQAPAASTDDDDTKRRKKLQQEAEEILGSQRNFMNAVASDEKKSKPAATPFAFDVPDFSAIKIIDPGITKPDPAFGAGASASVQALLQQPANLNVPPPPAVGQPVLGDSIAHVGESKFFNKERMMAIGKALPGMILSSAKTIAIRATIGMVAAAVFPAAAPILVPAAFLAYSAYKLGKSAMKIEQKLDEASKKFKEEGHNGPKAFLKALGENKLETAILLGSAVMLVIGATNTFGNITNALSNMNIIPSAQAATLTDMQPAHLTPSQIEAHVQTTSAAAEMRFPPGIPPEHLTPSQIETFVTATPSPQEQFREFIQGKGASAKVLEAAEKMMSSNPAVAAQGTKDAAFFLLNERGVPGNDSLAVALLKDAADHGNMQAKVDLAYLHHHGLAGMPAEPAVAIAEMKALQGSSPRAAEFVQAWTNPHPMPSAAPLPNAHVSDAALSRFTHPDALANAAPEPAAATPDVTSPRAGMTYPGRTVPMPETTPHRADMQYPSARVGTPVPQTMFMQNECDGAAVVTNTPTPVPAQHPPGIPVPAAAAAVGGLVSGDGRPVLSGDGTPIRTGFSTPETVSEKFTAAAADHRPVPAAPVAAPIAAAPVAAAPKSAIDEAFERYQAAQKPSVAETTPVAPSGAVHTTPLPAAEPITTHAATAAQTFTPAGPVSVDNIRALVTHNNNMTTGLSPSQQEILVSKLMEEQARNPKFAANFAALTSEKVDFSIVIDPQTKTSGVSDGLTGKHYTLHVKPEDLSRKDFSITEAAMKGVPSLAGQAWIHLDVIRNDSAWEAQLINAMDKGLVKDPAEGLVTIANGKMYYTHLVDPGSNDYVTHMISRAGMDKEAVAEVMRSPGLDKARVEFLVEPGQDSPLQKGAGKMLEDLAQTGKDPKIGYITNAPAGYSSDRTSGISLHVFQDPNGAPQVKVVTNTYAASHASLLESAKAQTPGNLPPIGNKEAYMKAAEQFTGTPQKSAMDVASERYQAAQRVSTLPTKPGR